MITSFVLCYKDNVSARIDKNSSVFRTADLIRLARHFNIYCKKFHEIDTYVQVSEGSPTGVK